MRCPPPAAFCVSVPRSRCSRPAHGFPAQPAARATTPRSSPFVPVATLASLIKELATATWSGQQPLVRRRAADDRVPDPGHGHRGVALVGCRRRNCWCRRRGPARGVGAVVASHCSSTATVFHYGARARNSCPGCSRALRRATVAQVAGSAAFAVTWAASTGALVHHSRSPTSNAAPAGRAAGRWSLFQPAALWLLVPGSLGRRRPSRSSWGTTILAGLEDFVTALFSIVADLPRHG
jgi:hypothetical protein